MILERHFMDLIKRLHQDMIKLADKNTIDYQQLKLGFVNMSEEVISRSTVKAFNKKASNKKETLQLVGFISSRLLALAKTFLGNNFRSIKWFAHYFHIMSYKGSLFDMDYLVQRQMLLLLKQILLRGSREC